MDNFSKYIASGKLTRNEVRKLSKDANIYKEDRFNAQLSSSGKGRLDTSIRNSTIFFPKADKYYQDALKFCEKERSEEPLTERHWLFLECDRARGLAKTNLKEADEAFARASESWKKISTSNIPEFLSLRNNPKTVAEIEYSLVAAKVAIAQASTDTEPEIIEQTIKEQEELKAKKLQTLKDNNASPFTLRELMFLP